MDEFVMALASTRPRDLEPLSLISHAHPQHPSSRMIAIGQRIIWALAIFVSGVVTREAIAQCPDLGPNPTPSASVSIEPEGVPVLTVTHGFDGVYARHSGGYTKHLALDWQLDSAGCPMSYVHPPLSLWPLLSSGDWEIWSDDPTWWNSVLLKTVTLAKKPILEPERVEWDAQLDLWLHLDYVLTGPIEDSYRAFFSTRLLDKNKNEIRETYTQYSAYKLMRSGTASKLLENWWGYVPHEAVYVRYYFQPNNREGVSGDVPIPPRPTASNIEIGLDLNAALYPQGVKMLVAKHRTDDDYPQPKEQEEPDSQGRPRMRIRGSVMDASTNAPPSGGTTIYLRLRDPGDSAPYVTKNKLALEGDNVDTGARLSTVGGASVEACTAATCGATDLLSVTVPAGSGEFEAILTGSTYAAGDNYQIEAFAKSNLDCSLTASCATSSTITLWKRAYVQERSSFVRGGRVAVDHAVDAERPADVVYVRLATGTKLSENQIVRFVHARNLYGADSCEYYTEERKILAVVRASDGPVAIKLNLPLDRTYYASDKSNYSMSDPRGADGFGVPAEGVHASADLSGAVGLLSEAFVELVELGLDEAPTMYPTTKLENEDIEVLSAKWFPQQAKGNHFLVISAGSSIDGDSTRLGVVHPAVRNVIWAFTGQINTYSLLLPEKARTTLAREVVAHEMSHGWRVNPDLSVPNLFDWKGHCKHKEEDVSTDRFVCKHSRFDDERKACIMNESFLHIFRDRNVMKDNLPAPEYYDGEEKFHFLRGVMPAPSEYMDIRRAHEPVTAY